jgi:hypothetical protein
MKIRATFSLVAFVVGFALAAAVLSASVSPVRAPQIGAKLDWLSERGAEYDTFFIGSSRVHRQIIPDLFDSEMAALGVKTNSFNLSGDGMRPPEDEFVMERAFARRSAPVRLLLVECNSVEAIMDEDDAGTARAVYWHDNARLARLWSHCWASSLSPNMTASRRATRIWKRLRQFPGHIQHWIWDTARVGQGSSLMNGLLLGEPERNVAKEVGADGYHVPKTSELMSGGMLRTYEKDLAAALKSPPPPDPEDSESQASLAWKKALADRLGARLVLISSPFLRPAVFVPQSLEGITFLDFSDPRRYPELYAPEHRRDPGHLNVQGSEIYTRHIARQIAAALKPQP